MLNLDIIDRPASGTKIIDYAHPPEPSFGLGELSVSWAPKLKRPSGWPAIPGARWSPVVVVFNGDDPTRSADNIDPSGGHRFVGLTHADKNEGGRKTAAYAPYIISRWTHFDRSTRMTTLFYTLSVEDPPYQPQIMMSKLVCQ